MEGVACDCEGDAGGVRIGLTEMRLGSMGCAYFLFSPSSFGADAVLRGARALRRCLAAHWSMRQTFYKGKGVREWRCHNREHGDNE